MPNQGRARTRRLLAWCALNLVIFITCYLNYRLQLKHRYLLKTLGVGLCLSRAAAMVINFNLILVWMPMCKYALTRLAVLANRSMSRQKSKLNYLMAASSTGAATTMLPPPQINKNPPAEAMICCPSPAKIEITPRNFDSNPTKAQNLRLSIPSRLARTIKRSMGETIRRVKCLLCQLKIKFTGAFLIAVDHCTSLHTICATTITVASVVHTVAHLMNVINFSNNFDPLLGDLNMAEYKGQNPLQLLVSVPGITGCFMVMILFLMSLSSISIIRNSSYDLFQVFHRLSVLFVILLILHPSSHVLKEQSNVDRHQPDFCYAKMLQLLNEQSAVPAGSEAVSRATSFSGSESVANASLLAEPAGTRQMLQQLQSLQSVGKIQSTNNQSDDSLGNTEWTTSDIATDFSRDDLNIDSPNITANQSAPIIDLSGASERQRRDIQNQDGDWISETPGGGSRENSSGETIADEFCVDSQPTFVAQNSICWYVLGAGLSCYLLDLLLRRLRRSRSSIQLLDACTDAEGNLVELVLSNNHKRFVHWLPGQFVYLNCPQIAAQEWHPFTISSMDNDTRQFTLHIKTGGDWTRKLRFELERQQQQQHCQKWQQQLAAPRTRAQDEEKAMSLFYPQQWEATQQLYCCQAQGANKTNPGVKVPDTSFQQNHSPSSEAALCRLDYSQIVNIVANLGDYNHKTGRPQVECKRVLHLARHQDNGQDRDGCGQADREHKPTRKYANGGCTKIDLDNVVSWDQKLYSNCPLAYNAVGGKPMATLDLFIDGPFHSPFERLLEQQVSVCIANGVGWTAFSSIFQKITNTLHGSQHATGDDWWSQWRNFQPTRRASGRTIGSNLKQSGSDVNRNSKCNTRLHLMVIVTTMEQFKPFYSIVKRYFDQLQAEAMTSGNEAVLFQNPVQEVTAFITRSSKRDSDVVEFCRKENLSLANSAAVQGHQHDEDEALRINDTLIVRFGRPDFGMYLSNFSNIYADHRKISVYCCGSYQVKKAVHEICRTLNRNKQGRKPLPVYQYHEENF